MAVGRWPRRWNRFSGVTYCRKPLKRGVNESRLFIPLMGCPLPESAETSAKGEGGHRVCMRGAPIDRARARGYIAGIDGLR